MKGIRIAAALFIVLSASWISSSAQSNPGTPPRDSLLFQIAKDLGSQKEALLGTWDLVITFSDGFQVKSTLSVLPGRSEGEGSVLHAAEATLLLPNPTTMEQGTWAHTGRRTFVETHFGYAVDGQFTAPAGKIGLRRHQITVDSGGDSFRGIATFEVRDTSDVVQFADQVQSIGRRQKP